MTPKQAPASHERSQERESAQKKPPAVVLREAAGYYTSRDLAEVLNIPPTSLSRYERSLDDPESGISLRVARAIADKLDCSLDALTGREEIPEGGQDYNAVYSDLSQGGKVRFKEYVQFLLFREKMIETKDW